MTNTPSTNVEFIPADQILEVEQKESTDDIMTHDWEQTMEQLATPGTTLRIPKNRHFNRQQVVQAFQNAFELIGGVPRLAIWANTHETSFFKLYARMMPKDTEHKDQAQIIIKHVLPRGALDE